MKLSDIYYHFGTNTDYSLFEEDGTLTFNGAATVWDDLRVPLYSRGVGSSPTYTSGFAGNANLYSWYFSNTGTNNLYFEMQMPHSWDGTTIYPHIHWCPTTTGTGSVRWILEYSWADITDTFGASATFNMDSTISTSSQWKHTIASNASGLTPSTSQDGISTMMVCRLYRVGGGTGDTYAASASLLAIDFHYRINTVGSRQEYVK